MVMGLFWIHCVSSSTASNMFSSSQKRNGLWSGVSLPGASFSSTSEKICFERWKPEISSTLVRADRPSHDIFPRNGPSLLFSLDISVVRLALSSSTFGAPPQFLVIFGPKTYLLSVEIRPSKLRVDHSDAFSLPPTFGQEYFLKSLGVTGCRGTDSY